MGEQPRTNKFEELTTEEWKRMIPYEEEWENKFTEESMSRSISIASGAQTPLLPRDADNSGGI